MRVLALIAVALLLAPSAQAATPLGVQALDEQIGETHGALQRANETHGDRSEFQAARVELGRAGTALTQGASVVSQTSLLKAQGALETGRAEAKAQGSDPDQAVAERARELAGRADANVSQLRADLSQAPAAGLDPVALDGLLAVSYQVLKAMGFLDQHRTHQGTWEDGHHDEEVARGLMGTAAAADTLATLALDLQARVGEARAEADVQRVITPEALAGISEDRVRWLQEQGPSTAQAHRDRVVELHGNDEHLLALAAFNLWYQDVTFNGMSTAAQRGQDVQPRQTAQDLLAKAGPTVDAWHAELGTASGTAQGALASAQFTLDRSTDAPGRQANQSGAYAASLVHRAVVHTGMLQEAFTDQAHTPGEPLAEPGAHVDQADAGQQRSIPGPTSVVIGAVAVSASLAGWARRPQA